MSLIPETPTPKKLLKEARAEPHRHPYELSDYAEVIDTLFKKGLSYGKIAKWLSVRLQGEVKRGQVFYVYKVWLENKESARVDGMLEDMENQEAAAAFDENPAVDPAIEEMHERDRDIQLDAIAAKEDSKRRGKRRKKP